MTAIASTENAREPTVNLSANAMVVGMLQSALSNLDTNLAVVPDLLVEIDQGDCWRAFKFPDQRGEARWNARQFREFIEAPRPNGCDVPISVLRTAVKDTPAWPVFERLLRGGPGGENNPKGENQYTKKVVNRDNITVDHSDPPTIPIRARDYSSEAPTGTSTSYALRRLQREARGDLLEKVYAGEITPNRAMVQAGLRRPNLQVKDDPDALASYLLKKWDRERIAALLAKLADALT